MQQSAVIFAVPASAGYAPANTDYKQRHTHGREQDRTDSGADPWRATVLCEHVLDHHPSP
ncbi:MULTISPECIES: hypothetical protein [Mycolicibacterium]|uniref:Uncharacterized protein n=1 Tax=Mycolicibacterium goodii TaxID=134601 RepID=A0ABS6HPF2_MYCGD|nr:MULTISPECIES: hypothetical protein [Mycolicibacterium]OKH64630.1 hypothetical protein EB74_09135 [Mycobacterium sp. SWH-M5]MBU8807769.1 hypothetical protein [Mycolicibacterium goodii]MBU8824549.1 hypothetical protein [Mycolicibacterium goodii]MBU8828110.1 hypothetical protein [Mycolicibacterium goodii]MBU8838278.1 hypothetical protein [Mycolicibacterium goodii]